jgi:hypothetical protein
MNRVFTLIILSLMTSVFMTDAQANDDSESKKSQIKGKKSEPVQKQPKVQQGFVPRAEITISESKDTTFKEYRIDGVLRAIKVTPKNGFPPYYLIDQKGDGQFVRIGPDTGPELKVPQWILFEW